MVSAERVARDSTTDRGFSPLHPRSDRDTPIQAIVLTNGDMDHCLGLLSLRESQPLQVYATEHAHRGFTEGNVLYRTLERFEGQVTWRRLVSGTEQPMLLADGRESGLSVRAFSVPGKSPVHLSQLAPHPEDNIGLRIREERTGKTLVYVSGIGGITPLLRDHLAGADARFFDGTFWSNDELPSLGLGEKRAEDMAHWPVGGKNGSLARLQRARRGASDSDPYQQHQPALARRLGRSEPSSTGSGVFLAHDGMELSL